MVRKDLLYWKARAKKYNSLDWLHKDNLALEIIKEVAPKKNQLILDLGTGTGKFANLIAQKANWVVGIDFSSKMLEHAERNLNTSFLKADLRNIPFKNNLFDTAIASHVFHHILDRTQKAMDESYRVLKKGGRMVLIEGIPPTSRTVKDYTKIFKLKEKRIVFSEQKLKILLERSYFYNVNVRSFYLKDISVRNWLKASGKSQNIQNRIFNLHIKGTPKFREDYNLKCVRDDCLITIRIAIATGIK